MSKKNTYEAVYIQLKGAADQSMRVAARYATEFFKDNIRKRGGYPQEGALERWPQRKYSTRLQRGKKLLQGKGRLRENIRTIFVDEKTARIGVDNPNVLPYARAHQEGAEIKVTPKMKGYFWAQHYKATGKKKTPGGKKKTAGPKPRQSPDAEFYKAMALKPVNSVIKIPRRKYLHANQDIARGAGREIERMFNDLNKK